MLLDEQRQQQQQTKQDQSGHRQLADGVAARQAGASSANVGAQVSRSSRT
jgi:hypothetical protein